MAKTPPINDLELKAIVDHEVRSAMGEIGGELAGARAQAMDYYLGEPVGPLAQPNTERSSVVLTTVRDTIEWIMPQLMRILAQADTIVEFDAVGYEDEQAAKQETQAINHIVWRQNEGFLIFYTWLKDALLQKNGIVKFWIEDYEDQSREEYDGLTQIALSKMLDDPELEPTEHDISSEVGVNNETLYHVVFKRLSKGKRIIIEVVPPEEWLISSDARSLDIQSKPPRFCGHYTEKYASDLREMGFSESDIELMKKGDERWAELDEEWASRYNLSDEQEYTFSKASHESLVPIRIVEGYMNLDINGDGYSELVRIWRAGDYIDAEEVDSRPFAALTPVILSHKFSGLSMDDLVGDLQEIGTSIIRNSLDNMYQVNNQRPVVNNRVDTDSLLTSRPGAPIYVDDEADVQGALTPYAPPPMWKDGLQMLEYLDGVRKDRTGVGDETMGLDPQSLANANTGVVLSAVEAARGKIELIARIFAETGIKWLFRGIHELSRKSYDQKLRYKLGKQYHEVNPQEWRHRTDLTVNVGTATGNMQQDQFALLQLSQMQEKMVAGGLMGRTVLPQNIYALAKDYADVLKQYGEKYFFNPMLLMDPKVQQLVQMQVPQPGPDPQIVGVQAMAQAEQSKAQAAAAKAKMEYDIKSKEAQMEYDIKSKELELKAQEMALETEIADMKNRLQGYQTDMRSQSDMAKLQSEAASKETQAALDLREQNLKGAIAQLQAEIEVMKTTAAMATQLSLKESDLRMRNEELAQDAARTALAQGQEVREQGAEVGRQADEVASVAELVKRLPSAIGEAVGKAMSDTVSRPRTVQYDDDGKIIQIG